MVKNPPANAGDVDSIPVSGRSPGGRNGNPLQYSCLENPMDRGACQATIHGVAKSWTGPPLLTCNYLKDRSFKCLVHLSSSMFRIISNIRRCSSVSWKNYSFLNELIFNLKIIHFQWILNSFQNIQFWIQKIHFWVNYSFLLFKIEWQAKFGSIFPGCPRVFFNFGINSEDNMINR